MNLLSYFQWYRRARGGYWAQTTGFFFRHVWVRQERPTADLEWIFYPWGTRTLGNGYIDEWYLEPDGSSAIPLSTAIERIFGTSNPDEIKKLIDKQP